MAGRFFIPMRKILNGFINLDLDQIALDIAKTPAFKELVIKLNTEGLPTSQLFEKGEDSTGISLESIGGEYAPFTIEEKKRKGQPTNRVTLKDTGDFYMTFNVIPFKGGFIIDANTIKDGENLEDDWGRNIIGLQPENLQIVIDFYKIQIQNRLNLLRVA